jgi:hypothetical protein
MKPIVLTNRDIFSDNEALILKSKASGVSIRAAYIVVKCPGAARSMQQVTDLTILVRLEADKAEPIAV